MGALTSTQILLEMMLAMEKEYQLVLQSIANKPAKTQILVNFTPIGMVGHAIAT